MKPKHFLFMLPVAVLLPWLASNTFSNDALLWAVLGVVCITSLNFTLRFYALREQMTAMQTELESLKKLTPAQD